MKERAHKHTYLYANALHSLKHTINHHWVNIYEGAGCAHFPPFYSETHSTEVAGRIFVYTLVVQKLYACLYLWPFRKVDTGTMSHTILNIMQHQSQTPVKAMQSCLQKKWPVSWSCKVELIALFD